jgi:hypothetical protein
VVTDSSPNLKDIIDILKRETSPGEGHRYVDLEEFTFDDDTRTKRKDDFECRLSWQKVPLYDMEAQEFLSFAQQDLEESSERGLVNALRNAKSAIGCRIDELLALSNLKGTSSSRFYWNLPNDLPYKMNVLRTLGIPAPKVLKNLVTQKRNLLEHEYVKPMEQQEIQNIVDVAELFLKATEQYIKKGYITSATIICTAWFEEGDHFWGNRHTYELVFDLKNETVTLTYSLSEAFGELRCGQIKEHPSDDELPSKEPANTVAIRDYEMEDVRDTMILLRKKAVSQDER